MSEVLEDRVEVSPEKNFKIFAGLRLAKGKRDMENVLRVLEILKEIDPTIEVMLQELEEVSTRVGHDFIKRHRQKNWRENVYKGGLGLKMMNSPRFLYDKIEELLESNRIQILGVASTKIKEGWYVGNPDVLCEESDDKLVLRLLQLLEIKNLEPTEVELKKFKALLLKEGFVQKLKRLATREEMAPVLSVAG